MNNIDIIRNIVSYIQTIMQEKHLTSRLLSTLCGEKGSSGYVSPSAIEKMLKHPSSTTISTLLKICDGLDLNLKAIFHSIELAKTSTDDTLNKLFYDINNPAFKGYPGKYHVFFLPTSANSEDANNKPLTHGILEFGDIYNTHECSAVLNLDTGDLNKNGEPIYKLYEGTLIYSSTKMMFCQLASNRYGDFWFLIFSHSDLNNKDLDSTIGCAATSSSGIDRYPAIHRFCLCNTEKYPNISPATLEMIQGILRLQNKNIIIKQSVVQEFLERDDINPDFKSNLLNHLNIAKDYYAIDKSALTTNLESSIYAESIAKLCNISALEKTYHIHSSDNRELSSILNKGV